MRVSERTIVALSKLFTGDPVDLGGEVQSLAPYRSGRDLVSFFNELAGGRDIYASGFPARQSYVEEKLRAANDTPLFGAFVEAALHPREFLFKDLDPGDAINYANRFLAYDDLTLVTSARG